MADEEPSLADRRCAACEGGTEALLPLEQATALLAEIPQWTLEPGQVPKIRRKKKTRNFRTAMEIANSVAEVAEGEGHHPDIHITSYRFIEFVLYTHSSNGLTTNDFIVAAKIDKLLDPSA